MKKLIRTTVPLMLFAAFMLTLSACGSQAATAETTAETNANVLDTIMTVGTTQAFSDASVSAEDIQAILQAGLATESAINQQPWFFVAVTDKDVMAEISASGGFPGGAAMPTPPDGEIPSSPEGAAMPAPPSDSEMPAPPEGAAPAPMASGGAKAALGDSPLAIIVYMDENTSSPNPNFDCGLAVQNMYLAAASLGYGVKIVSSPTMALNGGNHDQICEQLGVDPSMTAVAVLLVGKPDETVDGATGASTRLGLEEKTIVIE